MPIKPTNLLRAAHTAALPTPRGATGLRALVVGGLVLTVLTYLALGGYLLQQSRHQHERRAEGMALNLAKAAENTLTANIEKIDLAIGAVVDDLEQQLATRQADGSSTSAQVLDMARSETQVRAQFAHRPELDGLRVTDEHGLGILGDGLSAQTQVSFADREWFIRQRTTPGLGLHMSPPLLGKLKSVWIVSFSRRFNWPDGRFAGCVSASVPVSYFERLLASADVGAHGAVVLRNTELAMLARHAGPASSALSSAPLIGHNKVSEQLQSLIASGVEQAAYFAKATGDGIPRTTVLRRLKVAPLVVTVGLAPLDYLQDWQVEVHQVMTLCAGVVLLNVLAALLLLRLLNQNRDAQRRIALLATVFEHSGEAIMVTDARFRILEVNPAFARQTGYAANEAVGQHPTLLASERTTIADQVAIGEVLKVEGQWRGDFWVRARDGKVYPAWMSITSVRDELGKPTHHIASFIDISEVKRAEERLQHLAHHDMLTKLPNRTHLEARLEQAMASARRKGEQLAMLFVDMDRFKNINDMLGHHIGDGLLVEVARRLKATVRDSDIVARQGGDEFVLVLTGVGREGVRAANAVCRKLMAELSRVYRVDGHEMHSTPSIGVSLFPDDGEDADTLLRHADAAMYHAKAGGRNNWQFYAPAMNDVTVERLALEQGLRTALERGELSLQYQPQVELATGEVVAAEALVRWMHPELGAVPPMKFIGLAEETGQIVPIGAWVLDQAMAQVKRWRQGGHPRMRVAVNVSARQLQGDDFVVLVGRKLREHGLEGDALELEVTESAAMVDPERTAEQLRSLRALGVALAIDDFGTGYSSLSYLKQLPLSCLKLDKSFVMDIEQDANDAAISAATIQLAHNLGLAVVAEGVESVAQLDFLRGLECDIVQGYYLSKPLTVEACTRFLDAAAQEHALALA